MLLCEDYHIILSYLGPFLQFEVLNSRFDKVPKQMNRVCFKESPERSWNLTCFGRGKS